MKLEAEAKGLDYRHRVGIIVAGLHEMGEKDTEIMRDLNDMPVNVRALKLLKEAGAAVREGSLYCAQAALYALAAGMVSAEDDVIETANAMLDWRPQRIVNFLTLMYVDEYDPPGWKEAAGIREFAASILDDIENKMVMHFPYYRSPES